MITSLSNPKMKQLIQMQGRAKARREADAFIVEGIRMFCEAPEKRIREIYVTEDFLRKVQSDAEEKRETAKQLNEIARKRLETLSYEIVSDEVFQKITDTVTPQGILCVLDCYHYDLTTVSGGNNNYLLILEDIQDPGNLGTMFRTAEGAGIKGIVMSKGTVDVYNPKVVRATMGAIFRMPFVYVENMPDTVRKLAEDTFQIFAAALDGAVEYTEVDYKGKAAILIGNEGNGLTRETIAASTQPIYIPMEGNVESLNASISAAILMYHGKAVRDKH